MTNNTSSTHLVNRDHVAKADAQVLAHNLVDPDLGLLHSLVSQDNADCVLALLSLSSDESW